MIFSGLIFLHEFGVEMSRQCDDALLGMLLSMQQSNDAVDHVAVQPSLGSQALDVFPTAELFVGRVGHDACAIVVFNELLDLYNFLPLLLYIIVLWIIHHDQVASCHLGDELVELSIQIFEPGVRAPEILIWLLTSRTVDILLCNPTTAVFRVELLPVLLLLHVI